MTDDAAFTVFVQSRGSGLLRFAVALTGDRHHAEDLLQGALERVYGRWGKIADRGDPEWYVRRALVNAARDGWRRSRRRPEVFDAGEEGEGTYLPFDDILTRDVVRNALATLPPRQRIVIVLRYWEGMTEVETAALMNISVGTVKSQAHRAIKTLKERLSLEDEAFAVRGQGARR